MSKKNKSDGAIIKLIELLNYIFIIHLSFYIGFEFDYLSTYGIDVKNLEAYSNIAIYISVISVVVFIVINFLNMIHKTYAEVFATTVLAVVLINIGIMAIAFFARSFSLPRTVVLQSMLYQVFGLFLLKVLFLKLIRKLRGAKSIMIIATMADKKKMFSKIMSQGILADRVLFFLDPEVCDFNEQIMNVDKIFIGESINPEMKNTILMRCLSLHKSAYIVPETFEIATYRSTLLQFSDMPVFCVDDLKLSLEKQFLKRLFDIVFSFLGLIVLSPIILLTGIAILIFDGKPIFYQQERVTNNNKKFKLYKFRSMVNDAEKNTGAIWAEMNDDRITKVGKILRRFWIDEIPQLVNVLKGEMSLVGPRPERPIFIEEFESAIPHFNYRLTVKAGVTGLAQVLGKYSTTPEYKIKYDLMYIRNSSIFYDILIIFETVKKIIIGTLRRGQNEDESYKTLKKKYNILEKKYKGFSIYDYKI